MLQSSNLIKPKHYLSYSNEGLLNAQYSGNGWGKLAVQGAEITHSITNHGFSNWQCSGNYEPGVPLAAMNFGRAKAANKASTPQTNRVIARIIDSEPNEYERAEDSDSEIFSTNNSYKVG